MSLKQHNDIVEKLLKKIDTKDAQISTMKKELNKAYASASGVGLKPEATDNQKKMIKKINDLHKDYKQRIETVTQQLAGKTNQNKDLLERLNQKKKQEEKEREHLRKTTTMNAGDPKFATVISHYQTQMEKKDRHISNLQKQIKESNDEGSRKSEDERDQNGPSDANQSENRPGMSKAFNNQHYHTQYQQQIAGLKNELDRYRRTAEEKAKEYKDLNRRYSELTKDYYKILNEYGEKEMERRPPIVDKRGSKKTIKNTGISNTPQEMMSCENEPQGSETDHSLSYSFMTNLSKAQGKEPANCEDRKMVRELERAEETLESIMELIGVEVRSQIIPALGKIQAKYEEMVVHETASRFLQSMLQRLGMGKVPASQLIEHTEILEGRIQKLEEDGELMNELCIEAGAKKDKILEKLKDLKAVQQQFFTNMRDIKFMQHLPKANKITQFIEYFHMDKDTCELPDQLRKIYEQLKYVEKFMKHSNTILNKPGDGIGMEKTLEGILRFLERKSAEEGVEAASRHRKSRG